MLTACFLSTATKEDQPDLRNPIFNPKSYGKISSSARQEYNSYQQSCMIKSINCLISFWVMCVLLEIFWKTSLQMSLYVLIVLLIIVAKKYQHNKTLVYQ